MDDKKFLSKRCDDTTLKVAMAGFLHDLGKLVEIDSKVENKYDFEKGASTYLPPKENGWGYSHRHAFYTKALLDDDDLKREGAWPKCFYSDSNEKFGEGEGVIEIAARHHLKKDKDLTSYVRIIKWADCIASGFERVGSENEDDKDSPQDFFKTRLVSVLSTLSEENISDEDNSFNENYKYRFDLTSINKKSIYPEKREEKDSLEDSQEKYLNLLKEFKEELVGLKFNKNTDKRIISLPLWFEAFDSLWLKYAGNIPEARAGKIIKDTSLYDHSKITSAFATALYLYHKSKGDFENLKDMELEQEDDENKFLLIAGDFYGIQNFIFGDFGGEGSKGATKILRARSFIVSLFSELAADLLCRRLGLPFTSVVLNAAGNFIILAQNTEDAKKGIEEVKDKINKWFLKYFYGDCCIGFASVEASVKDFKSDTYQTLISKLMHNVEKEKYCKFRNEDFGVFEGYLDSFSNAQDVCSICGKRFGDKEEEGKKFCSLCDDYYKIGKELVKNDTVLIFDGEIFKDFKDSKLSIPIFDVYNIGFKNINKNNKEEKYIEDLLRAGMLLRAWNYSIDDEKENKILVARKYINSFVPKNEDDVLTFDDIAYDATCYENDIKKRDKDLFPLPSLAIVKADVDNLGMLMSCGLGSGDGKKRYTLSRVATISRQLNFFFAYYLPNILKNDYPSIYTVFGGGDDLFLIGPWNITIDLMIKLRKDFEKYVGGNKNLHFSAGICITKLGLPMSELNRIVEESLEKSKNKKDKNSGDLKKDNVTLFNQTVSWKVLDELMEIKNTLVSYFNSEIINNSFLYRLNYFIDMAEKEDKLKQDENHDISDYSCFRWKASLAYQCARNLNFNDEKMTPEEKKENQKKIYKFLIEAIEKYRGDLRIPLWIILYNIRGE